MATGYDDGAPILGEPTGLTRRSEVNKQGELLDPPEPGERTVTVAGVTDPVARVLLDSPVPHLDRTFDYLVPVAMAQEARPGTRVIVRFGEQEMRGWIWERGTTTTHIGRLSPLRRVVSDLQVLPKSSRRLIEAVAARSAGTRSDVVRLALVRKQGIVPGLRPDGKTQVTIGYDGQRPVSLENLVISTQHDEDRTRAWLTDALQAEVIAPVLEAEAEAEAGTELATAGAEVLINPSGQFVIGGPVGDAGLTGRKIIVDTYGGMARHGGGAFSGKDPSKVDRSASYAMRWVAKNVVAAGLASRCEIQVAYAIGSAHPVGIYVETFGTAAVPEERILAAVNEVFDLRPAAIVRDLDLLRPIYRATSAYGHFGRPGFTWEVTDRVEALRQAI